MMTESKMLCLAAAFVLMLHGTTAIPMLRSEAMLEDNELEPNVNTDYNSNRRSWVSPAVIRRKPGAPNELVCEVSGRPAPTIEWLQNNVPVAESFISNMLPKSSGEELITARSKLLINHPKEKTTYTCLARAGGKTSLHSTTVTPGELHNINEISHSVSKPKIIFYYTTVLEFLGSTVVLPCKATGSPMPEIYWFDSDEKIITNQDPRFQVMDSGELIIHGLRFSDMGDYRCIARTGYSEDTISTFLYPAMPEK